MEKTRIFLTIAVHAPADLTPLPGALRSSIRIGDWAKSRGYRVVAINDEHSSITVSDVRLALESAINQAVDIEGTEINRIAVYFAGHGIAKTDGNSYWLLTRWNEDWTEAISVQALQRVLRFYNPIQVSLIGDACRAFDNKSIDIIGSQILRVPIEEAPQPIEVDQFFAADAGEKAYMVPSTDGKDAFCLFSEVLLDGLEGQRPNAFEREKKMPFQVTSQSLHNYLIAEVPTRADEFGVAMTADPYPGFSTDRVYAEFESEVNVTDSTTGRSDVKIGLDDVGIAHEDIVRLKGTSIADSVKNLPPIVDSEVADNFLRTTSSITLAAVQNRYDKQNEVKKRSSDLKKRERIRDSAVLAWLNADAPMAYESHCGISISGVEMKSIKGGQDEQIEVDKPGKWFRVWPDLRQGGIDVPKSFVDLSITLEDQSIAYVCAVKNFIASLAFDPTGSASLIYHQQGVGIDRKQTKEILKIIAKMDAGMLSSEDIVTIAANIRRRKHIDLTLGCLAAYLYDLVGDTDGIRKTASFYPQYGQPVPIDIAILSGGLMKFTEQGVLTVDIPDTRKREPRNSKEATLDYTFEATPERLGARVAGLAPWMRGGWMAAETAYVDGSAAEWRDGILRLATWVTRSPFSVLKPGGKELLVDVIGTKVGGHRND